MIRSESESMAVAVRNSLSTCTDERDGPVATATSKGRVNDPSPAGRRGVHRAGPPAGDLQAHGRSAVAPRPSVTVSLDSLAIVSDVLFTVKTGYPPRALTLIPELPLSSLGLKSGEQIILVQKPDAPAVPSTTQRTPTTSTPATTTQRTQHPTTPSAPTPVSTARPATSRSATSTSPDSIETDGGVLVHRVCLDLFCFTHLAYVLVRLSPMTTRVCSRRSR